VKSSFLRLTFSSEQERIKHDHKNQKISSIKMNKI
jgi:hypothetical protein